jgi:uncharacterized protein YebE (UPF0316 family)
MTEEALLTALLIFFLRVLNNGIGTVRLVMLARGQRFLTAVLGFFEAFIFAVTVAGVVTDLTNWLNMLAYCGGFAVGSYLGMAIESRFITSYVSVNAIVNEGGQEIAQALRQGGYGVTLTQGEGLKGPVHIVRSVVQRRDVPKLIDIINETHPHAFVAVEEERVVHRGYIRAGRNQPTM